MGNKINDFTPILSEEKNLKFDCTIDELDTKNYRFDIDQDPSNGIVYLNIGYDDLKQYDSPIYLTYFDAIELAKALVDYATKACSNICNSQYASRFVNYLKKNLEDKKVDWIKIYPISLADQDYFPGCMIFDISYVERLKCRKYKKHNARIISCDYRLDKNDNYKLDDYLENLFKDKYNIPRVKIFKDRFVDLYNSIKKFNIEDIDKDKVIDDAFKQYDINNK